ncbi:cold-shock protein [Chloroflexota bacterium]
MPTGTIRRLMDRGYGFIKTEEGEDLFFHRNELQSVDYNSLIEGQGVEFEVGRGRDGRSQAVRVRLAAALEDVEATPSEPQAEDTMQEDPD